MNAPATPQQIGASVRRKEDYRFLTGAGQYIDDINQPRQTYAVFLRSPHAHAKIKSIATAAAMNAPGVVAIYTGADLRSTVGGLPCGWLIASTDGTPMKEPKHPLLAQGRVRYVGDQVAIVIAESIALAKDAAELIEVDYEVLPAVDKVIAKGKKIAAHLLEAADTDIEFKDGKFSVAGTDKSVPFAAIALTAYVPHNYPLDKLEPGLNENAFYDSTNFTFPAGTYICVVEVDPDTGHVRIDRWTAVDDFGNIVNPMIVEGQVHGGLAQGIGQALLEGCVYDQETRQLLTASYMDYAMPRADDLPNFTVATTCTPPALLSAICDATGARDVAMPATPHRVWQAMQQSKAAKAA